MVWFWVLSLGDRKSVKSRILLTVSRIGLTGKRNYLFVFKVVSTTIKYCCNVYHQARKGTGTVLVKCVSEKGASMYLNFLSMYSTFIHMFYVLSLWQPVLVKLMHKFTGTPFICCVLLGVYTRMQTDVQMFFLVALCINL